MSLTAAFHTARSSLQATSTQVSVSGRNVSGANDPQYSRKIATTTTTADGAARIPQVTRAADAPLYTRMLDATSRAAGQQAMLNGLKQLAETVADPQLQQSPAAKIGAFSTAVAQYSNAPDDPLFGQGVVTAGRDLVDTLNSAASAVITVRRDADADMATSVARINNLLGQFSEFNSAVVAGTALGADVTDMLDKRDGVLAALSEELGVTTITRENNDLAIYTDSGVTLFEGRARAVSFNPTHVYLADTVGNAVMIDGVPVTSEAAGMPLRDGRLAGLARLRDDVSLSYQRQLDEVARGVITAFAELDQSGAGGPALAGIFNDGGATIPDAGTAGIASRIRLSSAVDPAAGGSVDLIRDGGVNGADYRYNASGSAAYPDRLLALAVATNASQSFAGDTGLASPSSLADFATASVGWLESRRQTATTETEYQTAVLSRASESLSNATGVNLDEEYANQLQLERSYAASAKLISIIDELFKTLLASAG
ncbi:flagellar hook-associated protein FlgK [Pseudoxanthobacter sp. M-2]|uniref:flagellar hook-associated protein FlgK n=1 Tax=Pseudoxanthobacter sp. M-2 TaxID=3078754 RepID=UPI0038FC746D